MEKLTVVEYCKRYGVTPQAVYPRIKRGTLEAVKEHGITMILVNDETATQGAYSSENNAHTIDYEDALIKHLNATIKRETKKNKDLNKRIKKLEILLLDAVKSMMKFAPLQVDHIEKDAINADIEEIPRKNKKSKKKKKKKK